MKIKIDVLQRFDFFKATEQFLHSLFTNNISIYRFLNNCQNLFKNFEMLREKLFRFSNFSIPSAIKTADFSLNLLLFH